MSVNSGGIAESYQSLLREHLRQGGEATLQQAYELGRRALTGTYGLLGMTALHNDAVLRLLREAGLGEEKLGAVRAAQILFIECLSPYEMTQLGHREAIAARKQWNERLEAESKRIAHLLHDESGQLLATAHFALDALAQDLSARDRRCLEEVRGILHQIEEQLRRISHELRPTILDDLGLVPALEFLSEGVSKRNGLVVRVEGRIQGRLPPGLETTLYRIVQEALNNVSRHSQAAHAAISLWHEVDEVVCAVTDDGIGFDGSRALAPGSRRGIGLIGIEERLAGVGGTLCVTSSPGAGTQLTVRIPLERGHVDSHSAR